VPSSGPVRAENTWVQQTEMYYTVEEVAIIFRRGKDWVWAQSRDRKIPHHRLGRTYRFSNGDLKELAAKTAVVIKMPEEDDDLVPSKARRRRIA
jgi:excisionase family DNA binding protein